MRYWITELPPENVDKHLPTAPEPPYADRTALSAATIAEAARSLYSGVAPAYRIMQSLRPYICPFETILPWVPGGSRVLDIGCGAGLWLGLLSKFRGLRYGFGTDLSQSAIKAAREMAASNHLDSRLSFHCGQGVATRNGDWDIVSMIDVLHHVPVARQKDFFCEAARLTPPSGRFVFKDMTERPLVFALCNKIHDLMLAGDWPHMVAEPVLRRWAAEQGLVVESVSVCRRLWYQHRTMIFSRPG